MLAVAGTAPRAPNASAGKMSVSRPISTEKRSGTTRRYSQVFWRSPLESLTPRMFGISASRATVSTPIIRPPQVERVELAVGAEHEDAVDAAVDEVVDEPLEAREVEVFVGQHRRGDGGDDALDAHGLLTDEWIASGSPAAGRCNWPTAHRPDA